MRTIWIAASATLAVACLTGCDAPAGQAAPATPTVQDNPQAAPALDRFYRQPLNWQPCEKFQCATLAVPVDYAKPDGRTFTLPLIKAPATGQRLGTLVAGAGGPGQSGVTMIKDSVDSWPAAVRERFDIVSFDPRGVGGSNPKLVCKTDGEPAGEQPPNLPLVGPTVPASRQFAQACLKQTGEEIIRHLGTADVVSDLDVLRAATGQDKLTYVGYSYGTRIGQLYADRFPHSVRGMVLDGVDNTYLDWRDDALQQAEGAEQALHAYARDCAARTQQPCPGRTEAEVLATVDRLLARTGGDEISQTITNKVIFPSGWAELSKTLIDADHGVKPERDAGPGGGDDPAAEDDAATSVVNCMDRPHPTDLNAYEHAASAMRAASRLSDGSEALSCAFLPTATVAPKQVHADGAPPILLVGSRTDGATPYRWAQALAGSMRSAVLLTNDDVGHSVFGGASPCIDEHVARYLIDVTAAPATCPRPS